MLEKRTDLALEQHELNAEKGIDDGIISQEKTLNGFKINTVEIKDERAAKASGKKEGKYITADIGKSWHFSKEEFMNASETVKQLIIELLPKNYGTVLAVGLGNNDITADSIGPEVVSGIIVTHHIKEMNRTLYDSMGFGDIAAMTPGVLGKTGIESAEIIKGTVNHLKPDCVIIIDALASRRLSRLATSIQLSNTGISPGSGIANNRCELTCESLGTAIISIGVPTVVDAATLAFDIFEEFIKKNNGDSVNFEELVKKELRTDENNFYVTPKESDIIIKSTAKLIAYAINLAIHKGIDYEEITELNT